MPRLFSKTATQNEVVTHYTRRLRSLAGTLNSFSADNPATILSIGSGTTPVEISALIDRLGCSIQYLGVELDPQAVESCNEKFKDFDNIHFVAADGKDATAIKTALKGYDLPTQVDLIVVRHPVFHSANAVRHHFTKIWLETLPGFLKPGGQLIASFYHPEEFQTGLELTRTLVQKPDSVQDLGESRAVSCRDEIQRTALRDIEHKLFEDRFAVVISNFEPVKALAATEANQALNDTINAKAAELARLSNIESSLYQLINNADANSFANFIARDLTDTANTSGFELASRTRFSFAKYKNNSEKLTERFALLLHKIHAVYAASNAQDPATPEDIVRAIDVAARLPLAADLKHNPADDQTEKESTAGKPTFGIAGLY